MRSLADAVRDPAVRRRGEVVPLPHPVYGENADLWGTGVPITFSDSTVGFDKPAPYLGADTDSVLRDLLGYEASRVESLRESGVV